VTTEPDQAAVLARRQQRLQDLCGATVRALSGRADLQFRGLRLHEGRHRLPLLAPHLHPDLAEDDLRSFRGAADGLALRLMRSDAALHRRLSPADPVQRLLFDLLEQLRAESLVPARFPGLPQNLQHRFTQWSRAFHRAGLTDSARGILIYTVAQMARARVVGEPVLADTEDLIEATRAALAPSLGHALAGLRRHRAHQAAYAVHALAIAREVGERLRSAQADAAAPRDGPDAEAAARAAFGLAVEEDPQGGQGGALASQQGVAAAGATAQAYRVFTRAYDREWPAAALARPPRLREWRGQLDRRVAALGIPVARLAREIQAMFALPQPGGWESAREEGRIDGRALARLVASPRERRLFRDTPLQPQAEVALTLLLDCSGSMRRHVESLAPLLDLLLRALELAGVSAELLGFSTGGWHGGRAWRDWQRAGRPQQPGRLNERWHVVFKDADTPWRRARPGIAALLGPELFREGLDGEAVDWAAARLLLRDEPRKLLLVLSDGCPMDGATQQANSAGCLEQHLREVLQRHERQGQVRIAGLGVGLELSDLYPRSQALDLHAVQGMPLLREMLRPLLRG
jgi:cobaltochelatase CobT